MLSVLFAHAGYFRERFSSGRHISLWLWSKLMIHSTV